MKRLLTLALVALPLLSMAQDDLYFTSSKKAKQAAQQARTDLRARTSVVVPPTIVDYNSNTRSDDEYNRRYVYGGEYQNAGGYADDSLTARIDTVAGYYADSEYDMDDPELDYRFSRRLVRFHSPRHYALTSPYYWDLYYGCGAWDYLYDFYDPWYWHYGWGYGWSWGPWDCWYGGIWGWHHPYAWSYWGWGPGWGHVYGGGIHYRNVIPREYNASRGHMAAGSRIRTNAMGGNTFSSRGSAFGGRTNVVATRTNVGGRGSVAQGVRTGTTRGSYTDYTNARTGRSSASGNEGARTQVYNRSRENASQRSTVNRDGTTYQPSRSYNNQNSSSRVSTPTRSSSTTNRTSTYSGSSRSSSSYGGGSYSGGGSRGGGGFGGGSRGGGGGGRR